LIATLLQVAALFGTLSLLAVGGGNAVIPAMQHQAVDVHGWMSAREFLDLFAISRAAPGPGSLIVVLVGQKAAGLAGALVAALAMYGPSCLLVHLAARVWRRFEAATWRHQAEQALAPVAVGLTFASGLVLMQGTEHDILSRGLTAATTILLAVTELNPLAVMAASAVAALIL
jgi:chromate transporter